MKKASLAIVIPCYNEYDRWPSDEFYDFLQSQPGVVLCLVDDASTDKTLERLQGLQKAFPEQVHILLHTQNKGKAEAVRKGVLHCHHQKLAPNLAYLDADLATSLEECLSLLPYMEDKAFVFASRILRVGSVVERRFSRFFIGRIIATVISNILGIAVYDTQCGCKLMHADLVPLLFTDPFRSRWLFDVELFSRILAHYGPEESISLMEEVPIKRWVDRGESKVRLSYFFNLWKDLWNIRRRHRIAMRPWRENT